MEFSDLNNNSEWKLNKDEKFSRINECTVIIFFIGFSILCIFFMCIIFIQSFFVIQNVLGMTIICIFQQGHCQGGFIGRGNTS